MSKKTVVFLNFLRISDINNKYCKKEVQRRKDPPLGTEDGDVVVVEEVG